MKRRRKHHTKPAAVAAPARTLPAWTFPAVIFACVALFYWVPLTSSSASIQWDAADMHYPLQKYFSDHLRAGVLPFWSPYLFSGYPILANTEMAVWYLPHWPFFLAGIAPRVLQLEIALHAFIACLGAYFFLSQLGLRRSAGLLGSLAYGLSGFFAGHSSHVGLFCAAAWLPWLLEAYQRATGSRTIRYTALGALAGGMMILAGYFQTALYGFLALGLFALSGLWSNRNPCTMARQGLPVPSSPNAIGRLGKNFQPSRRSSLPYRTLCNTPRAAKAVAQPGSRNPIRPDRELSSRLRQASASAPGDGPKSRSTT